MLITKILNEHFSKCWLGVDYDFRWIMPRRIAYIMIRNVTRKECPDLFKDFRKGEIIHLCPFFDNGFFELNDFEHINDLNPFDFYQLPEDSVLQLSFDN